MLVMRYACLQDLKKLFTPASKGKEWTLEFHDHDLIVINDLKYRKITSRIRHMDNRIKRNSILKTNETKLNARQYTLEKLKH